MIANPHDVSDVRKQVREFLATPRPLLIDGGWHAAASGATFDVYDPGRGAVVAQVARGDSADVDMAVAAARQAFDDRRWLRLSATDRAKVLWKVADLIEVYADELAMLETLDQGLPIAFARHGMIPTAARSFRYYAGMVDRAQGISSDLSGPSGEYHAYTLREPVGVAALIIPWNAPIVQASWKLAPALAAGCSCVLKPAEQTPLTALRLGELLIEAGVPAGVVNIISGFGDEAGAALAAHADVDKVSFTGSTDVGRMVIHAAAGNLKKVTLELGGKSPVVILDDADLSRAIPGAAGAIFNNTGQVCSAGSRLFVSDNVFDQVVDGVAAIGAKTRIGYGLDPESEMGPLISAEQRLQVSSYIESGVAEGATLVTGGHPVDGDGYFIQPTVMVNTHSMMRMVREEIFGPVVAIRPIGDLDEVARLANDTVYGLAASIWTRDVGVAHSLARKIRCGRLGINVHSPGDYTMPTGGYKQSGWGREHGPGGLDPYLETKSVFTALGGPS